MLFYYVVDVTYTHCEIACLYNKKYFHRLGPDDENRSGRKARFCIDLFSLFTDEESGIKSST